MSLQVIPLDSSPNQSFTVQLSINDKAIALNVELRYNEMASYWILKISDAQNNLLVDSIPVVVGTWPAANLLGQFRYLNIGSWYIINVSNLTSDSPSTSGYGMGGFGSGGYGGDEGMSGFDWPNNRNLGTDFELWIEDNLT